MKSLRAIAVLLVVAACVALAGAAVASKGSKPARQLPQSMKVNKATPSAKPAAADTDNVQSGDQNAPEQSEQQSSEAGSESSGDNEAAGQAGEPAQGHEDAAGQDADHHCTGNCQE
jgi:hypothetical protein